MATLLRRLQTRGPRPYRPQQPLSIHGHEEFELQTSALSSETVSIPLPNRLPSGQGKQSCRCLVTISSENCWGKRHPPCQKRQDLAISTVLVSQNIWSFDWLKWNLPFLPGLHMQNNCASPAMPVRGLSPKGHSSRQPLHCQHRRHETTFFRAARKRRGSKASQRGCRPSGGLRRCQRSATVLKTPICPRDHPLRGDKSSPQWSSGRTFRHWQDKRVGRSEILLAGPEKKRWKLCPRMWHLPSFKASQTEALWWPIVFAYTNSSVEGPLHRLRDRIAVVRWLEGRQLRLDSCHCRLVDQDGVSRANQSHHWCAKTSRSHHRRGSLASRSTRLSHNW